MDAEISVAFAAQDGDLGGSPALTSDMIGGVIVGDYVAQTGTATFAIGTNVDQAITIPVKGDYKVEDDETAPIISDVKAGLPPKSPS